ncbi:hypothetical protein VNO80_21937 [Phaseolus coccineus]|uniref:Uncharacterized protein n=1 Tax=Phaseolus coccineus TaxID=3886 RepID=A0AAN9M8R3_PHACN
MNLFRLHVSMFFCLGAFWSTLVKYGMSVDETERLELKERIGRSGGVYASGVMSAMQITSMITSTVL